MVVHGWARLILDRCRYLIDGLPNRAAAAEASMILDAAQERQYFDTENSKSEPHARRLSQQRSGIANFRCPVLLLHTYDCIT